jgi:hypothetical protein
LVEHGFDATDGGTAFGIAARHDAVDVDDDRPCAMGFPERHQVILGHAGTQH